MRVSIIVPVHNAFQTLDRCVKSIINQNYEDIECILVENGSEDQSLKVCLEYSREYRNVIAVSNNSVGASVARNKGLLMATGDIIGFCDADDFLEPDAICSVVEVFQNNSSINVVIGAFYRGCYVDEILKKEYVGLKNQIVTPTRALQLTVVNDSIMGSVWNKYYRTKIVKNKEFSPELSFCEDMHFNAQVLSSLSQKSSVEIIQNPVYCYMENVESITHQKQLLFDKDGRLNYIVALENIIKDCCLNRKTVGKVKMKMTCLAIDTLNRFSNGRGNATKWGKKKIIY